MMGFDTHQELILEYWDTIQKNSGKFESILLHSVK
jgi:hypothetical protein